MNVDAVALCVEAGRGCGVAAPRGGLQVWRRLRSRRRQFGERAGGRASKNKAPRAPQNPVAERGGVPSCTRRATAAPKLPVGGNLGYCRSPPGQVGERAGGKGLGRQGPTRSPKPRQRRTSGGRDSAAASTIAATTQSRTTLRFRLNSPHRRRPIFRSRIASAGAFPTTPAGHRARTAPPPGPQRLGGAPLSSCTPA